MELLQLQLGELVNLKVRRTLSRANFATLDTIPRSHASTRTSRFYTPKVTSKGVTAKDEAALTTWLSWRSKDQKQIARLKLPTARAPALPSVEQSIRTRKQRDRMRAKHGYRRRPLD